MELTAGKKVEGRKHHIVTDTMGHLLKVKVHDALFTMHSNAPCITFAVKDRVPQQTPMAAIYGVNSYYKRLLQEDDII